MGKSSNPTRGAKLFKHLQPANSAKGAAQGQTVGTFVGMLFHNAALFLVVVLPDRPYSRPHQEQTNDVANLQELLRHDPFSKKVLHPTTTAIPAASEHL